MTKYVNGEKTVSRNPVKKYINSFGEVEYRGEKYTNFEALLCKAVEEKGIPVAIGDPNEKINDDSPIFGAVRIYADDDTWKQIVEDYFTNSKAVVLYVDFTDGVKWELNQAINKYQDKVIFVPKLYNKHVSFLKTLAKFPLTALFAYPFYFVFV